MFLWCAEHNTLKIFLSIEVGFGVVDHGALYRQAGQEWEDHLKLSVAFGRYRKLVFMP